MPDDSEIRTAGQFNTTHWSVVLLAGQKDSAGSAAALESLCRAYWPPIYFFARRKGHNDADAKDLTQQFFSLLLTRNDFAGLDAGRGKFRTFLLASFTHFLANEHDRGTALKRGGGQIVLSLDDINPEHFAQFEKENGMSAAGCFDTDWALTVIGESLSRLKAEMIRSGKELQFELLRVFLTTDGMPSDYSSIAERLAVAAASVPVWVHRLRQRYRELVRDELAQTVGTPADLEEEMRHLFNVLNQQ